MQQGKAACRWWLQFIFSKGYEGRLCGSCAEGYGNFKLACFECMEMGLVVFFLLVMTAWLMFTSYIAVEGNLTEIHSQTRLYSTKEMTLCSWTKDGISEMGIWRPDIDEEGILPSGDCGACRAYLKAACDFAKKSISESLKVIWSLADPVVRYSL